MMTIFDAFNVRLPGESGRRRPVNRAEAEDYAASLGLRPGGPGWGDAIRDYVLNGALHVTENSIAEPMSARVVSDGWDGDPNFGRIQEPDLETGPQYSRETPAIAAGSDIQLAQVAPQMRGRPGTTAAKGIPSRIAGFGETDPKSHDFWRSVIHPTLHRPSPPKKRPGNGDDIEIQKRHFTTGPRRMDTAPIANRIADSVTRLPEERRQISERYRVPLTSTPAIDRYYSTMLAREDGLNKDGTLKVNHLGMVGPAQMDPKTAPDAARYAGIPYYPQLLYEDQAYNEMLGLAYYKWLLDQFDGDFAKAAAGYNWSPGKTKRAIRAAQKAGEPRNWEKYLAEETGNYVEFFRKFNQMQND